MYVLEYLVYHLRPYGVNTITKITEVSQEGSEESNKNPAENLAKEDSEVKQQDKPIETTEKLKITTIAASQNDKSDSDKKLTTTQSNDKSGGSR